MRERSQDANGATEPPARRGCVTCGEPVGAIGESERCLACLDRDLRSIDASFLDSYARFGARSRQVVAEACLRALVLSDLADRKILGVTVYEQFVQASADLINLYYALQAREQRSIAHSFLSFSLDQAQCLNFFADMIEFSPTDILGLLGLVDPGRVPLLFPEMTKRESRELTKTLHEVVSDIGRLAVYQEMGETALVQAADQMRSVSALTDRFPWAETGRLAGDQVASLAIDTRRGRLSLNSMSVDETRLGEVVDGIDVMTRLTRNLIYAFLSINAPDVLRRPQ
jgi:hypothetical protein